VQKNIERLKRVNEKELDTLDRFLRVLWRKEVAYNKYLIKAYL
tara:strand:- start:511 stop:639 length:129 start_codon:yes stop_codon:yes gene_type:complete